MPQPNVSDFGRGINNVPMPVDPSGTTSRIGLAPPPPPPPPPPQWQPPPMPDYMTPAMSQYVSQFQASQAQQQQAINSGLLQAMQGLGQRRDAAAKLVASVPGQYNAIQAQATQAANSNAGAPTVTAGQGAGVAQAAVNSNNALIAEGNRSIGQAGASMTPLLNMGVAADYSKGQTTLNNTHMMNQAAIAQQQTDFDQKMAEMKASAAQDWMKMQYGYHHDDAVRQQERTDPNNMNSVQGQEAYHQWMQDHGLEPKNTANGAADLNAQHFHFNDAADMQAASSGPWYQAVSQALVTGKNAPLNMPGMPQGSTVHGGNRDDLLKQVVGSNVNTLWALRANGLISDADVIKALGGKS
jgi:hypothetical protein